MREFEKWLEYKTVQSFNTNIFYVDLGCATKKHNRTDLSLGYKVKDNKGSYWQSIEISVESDFTEDEFLKMCMKYEIKCSIRIGE